MANSNDASKPTSSSSSSSSSSQPKLPRPTKKERRQRNNAARQNKDRLSTALAIANEAVRLDNEQCEDAIQAYHACAKIMDDINHSLISEKDELSVHGREDSRQFRYIEMELERLGNIARMYADRLKILCGIYKLDPVTLDATMPSREENANTVFDALAAYNSVYPLRLKSKL